MKGATCVSSGGPEARRLIAGIGMTAAALSIAACAATPRGLTPDDDDGRVELSCTVNADGSVTGCVATREEPAGLGLAEIALSSARSARLTPRSLNGAAIGGNVRFTVRIAIENGVVVVDEAAADPAP